MTEERTVPELYLDPDGRPFEIIDLQGDPRRFTAWGMVCANGVHALVCTDTDETPTVGDLRALAAAMDDGRTAALTDLTHRQADRVIELAEQLAAARRTCRETTRLAVLSALARIQPRRYRR